MTRGEPEPTYDELRLLVVQLQAQVQALSAENAVLRAEHAALRAELATLRGEEPPPAGAEGPPGAAPRRRPPRWAKANVVVVARRRPRKGRSPVPGRRREAPDRIVLHAPTVCPACAA